MKLSKAESEALRANLPMDAINRIHRMLRKKITTRMIRLVLDGERTDHHRVIHYAALIAKEHKAKLKRTQKMLAESIDD